MPFAPTPTPIACPFCRAQITVPLRQIVDVAEEPTLKSALLAGRLNAFTCPVCHNSGALASPFLYHDPAKELAFIFLPMQIGLKDADQQRVIGQLTNALMSRLPPEKRKGYLLTPKQFFTLQSLLDAILEADGITKEMLEAQEAKVQLLQQMLETTDSAAQEALIREHDADIDVMFFQLVNAALSSTQADRASPELSQLLAFRNKLLEMTTIGKKVQVQQAALEAFQAKPDRATLLEQIVQAKDAETRELLLTFGRPLLDYPFFQALTAKIEASNAAGDKAEADRLIELRKDILSLREKLDAATKTMLDQRAALLREIMLSENLDEAVRAHLADLDEAFFSVLETNLQAAEQAQQRATFDRLQAVAEAVSRAIAAAQPPEVRFVNALLSLPYPDETRKLLEANRRALSPQLLDWMRGLAEDLREDGRADAADQLLKIIEQATEVAGTTAAAPSTPAEPVPPAAPATPKPQILIAKR
jgi:CpXC protein